MMNKQGVNVATLGNDEFDNGLDMLALMLEKAEFDIVCSNYDFSNHALDTIVKKSVIVEKAGLKFGFIGIGVNPDGLIDNRNLPSSKFMDPVESMNKYAAELKKSGCDYIIVLSHLGIYNNPDKGDELLAKESTEVDLIIGGHTHVFLDGCLEVDNKNGKKVVITQSGSRGAKIGKINVNFEKQ